MPSRCAATSNAAHAWEAGKFDAQLVPVEVPQRKGDPLMFAQDEGFRADASMESLGKLRALEGGVVTAGNASQQNDAAAACLVVAEDKLRGSSALEADAVVQRLRRRRLRPEPDGHRPGSGGRAAVRAHRHGLGRDRSGRAQRGVRPAGARGAQGLGLERGRQPAGHAQRQRLGHQPRPPDRRHRRAHPRRHGARDAPAAGALRARDDVHRRRPGHRRGVRARGCERLVGLGRARGAADRHARPGASPRAGWRRSTCPRQTDGAMPQGVHFALCTPDAPTAALGDDGHPARDDDAASFLPPVPLPRRMWAASAIEFLAPIAVGAAIERTSRVASVTPKSGRSGRDGVRRGRARNPRRRRARRCARRRRWSIARPPRPSAAPARRARRDGRFDPAGWHGAPRACPRPRRCCSASRR